MTQMADAKKTLFEPELTNFLRYDFDHPEIWHQFRAITFDLINRVKHYKAEAIFEIIKYNRIVKHNEFEFNVDGKLTAYYAEKFINRYPQHKGFFELKRQTIIVQVLKEQAIKIRDLKARLDNVLTIAETADNIMETLKGFVETELKSATDILDLPDVKNYQSSGSYTLQNNTKRFIAAAQCALAQIKRN